MAEEGKSRSRSKGSSAQRTSTRKSSGTTRKKPAPESAPPAAEENGPTPSGESHGPGETWVEDISDTTAPSIGPHSVVVHKPPVDQRENIDLDAMGKDKRRPVVGQGYGPSKGRQLTLYGLALLLVAALAIGAKLLVDSQDTFPSQTPHNAPWAQPGAPQHPPKPLQ